MCASNFEGFDGFRSGLINKLVEEFGLQPLKTEEFASDFKNFFLEAEREHFECPLRDYITLQVMFADSKLHLLFCTVNTDGKVGFFRHFSEDDSADDAQRRRRIIQLCDNVMVAAKDNLSNPNIKYLIYNCPLLLNVSFRKLREFEYWIARSFNDIEDNLNTLPEAISVQDEADRLAADQYFDQSKIISAKVKAAPSLGDAVEILLKSCVNEFARIIEKHDFIKTNLLSNICQLSLGCNYFNQHYRGKLACNSITLDNLLTDYLTRTLGNLRETQRALQDNVEASVFDLSYEYGNSENNFFPIQGEEDYSVIQYWTGKVRQFPLFAKLALSHAMIPATIATVNLQLFEKNCQNFPYQQSSSKLKFFVLDCMLKDKL